MVSYTSSMPIKLLNKVVNFLEKYWLPLTVLFLSIITYLSLKPQGPQSPISHADKIYHCIAYAGLTLPLALKRPSFWIVGAMGLILFGGAIELIQPYTGRSADWLDFIANGLGVVIAVAASYLKRYVRPTN